MLSRSPYHVIASLKKKKHYLTQFVREHKRQKKPRLVPQKVLPKTMLIIARSRYPPYESRSEHNSPDETKVLLAPISLFSFLEMLCSSNASFYDARYVVVCKYGEPNAIVSCQVA